MNYKQIIRWAGSKRKLLPILRENVPNEYTRYVEPFCGSACLFFELRPKRALLCDINADLINALKEIRDNHEIHSLLKKIPNSKEEYYRIRSLSPNELNDSERAVRFLYLNRYCFNGVYRTNKKGKFNVPRGTKTGSMPNEEVFSFARSLLSKADLYSLDYSETLSLLEEGDFVYLDPPYSKAGKFTGEYGLGSLDSSGMRNLIDSLTELDGKGIRFLLSYRDCQEFSSLVSDKFLVEKLTVKRHVAGFKKSWGDAEEILVKNYER